MRKNVCVMPTVVIDGQNLAGNGKGKKAGGKMNFELAEKCAKFHYEQGSKVILVVPIWVEKKLSDEIRKIADIVPVYIGKDKSLDDQQILGLTVIKDGYYVSNDTKMSKHTSGTLINREWCAVHRIGYTFSAEGEYIPKYPVSWHSRVASIVA